MNITLSGCGGKMGAAMANLIKNTEMKIVAGIDKNAANYSFPIFKTPEECTVKADLLIDFSHPSLLSDILNYCVKNNLAAVIGTTGLSAAQRDEIQAAAEKIPLFYSSNMSWGVFVLNQLVAAAAKYLHGSFDIEIIESHHRQKADAPSGTAVTLLNNILSAFPDMRAVYGRDVQSEKRTADEIGMHAVRGGTIAGRHEVLFAGDNETIAIIHNAESREIFARGALKAAAFLAGQRPGLYGMESLAKFKM